MALYADAHPCYVYIDGEYVRAQLKAEQMPYFDPRAVLRAMAGESILERGIEPLRTFFYDALDERADEAERQEREDYLNYLEHIPDVSVRMGRVRPAQRKERRRQVGVDILLAVDALEAAWTGKTWVIDLVAGDGDFVPLVEAIQRAGPHVIVLAFKSSCSSELAKAPDRIRYLPEKPPRDWELQRK